MDEKDHDAEYGLVTPFVVCTSVGGPYDDDSFVAGIRLGLWQSLLKLQPSEHANYEPAALVPQLDLLAMQNGYRMISEPYEESPNWVLVTMTRGGEIDDHIS